LLKLLEVAVDVSPWVYDVNPDIKDRTSVRKLLLSKYDVEELEAEQEEMQDNLNPYLRQKPKRILYCRHNGFGRF
jgi:hypothetical protein